MTDDEKSSASGEFVPHSKFVIHSPATQCFMCFSSARSNGPSRGDCPGGYKCNGKPNPSFGKCDPCG